jgi:hypothetical protein
MRREVWKSISPQDDGFLLETQMSMNMGERSLRIGEVHIPFVELHDVQLLNRFSGGRT